MSYSYWGQLPGMDEAGRLFADSLAEIPNLPGISAVQAPGGLYLMPDDGGLAAGKPAGVADADWNRYISNYRQSGYAGTGWIPSWITNELVSKYPGVFGNTPSFIDRNVGTLATLPFALVTGGASLLQGLSDFASTFAAPAAETLASVAPAALETVGVPSVDLLDSLSEFGYDAFSIDTPFTLPDAPAYPDWLTQTPAGDVPIDPNASAGGPAANLPPSYNPVTRPFGEALLDKFKLDASAAAKAGSALLSSATGASATSRLLQARATQQANAVPFHFGILPGQVGAVTSPATLATAAPAFNGATLAVLGLVAFMVMR